MGIGDFSSVRHPVRESKQIENRIRLILIHHAYELIVDISQLFAPGIQPPSTAVIYGLRRES
jgi:hypothetical protein